MHYVQDVLKLSPESFIVLVTFLNGFEANKVRFDLDKDCFIDQIPIECHLNINEVKIEIAKIMDFKGY